MLRTLLGQLIDSVARPSSGVQSYTVHRARLGRPKVSGRPLAASPAEEIKALQVRG
jgi:hypothetical protein